EDYDDILRRLGIEYFIHDVGYVSSLMSWSKENKVDLSEPYQPMKLMTTQDNVLKMVIQSEVSEEMLDGVITNLAIRWSLRNNIADPSAKLNSVKKRLVFCFLKECAGTVKNIGGDELLEDEWAVNSMEKLGLFNE
ncbi:MAG TPA: hypothetical protein DHW81_05745, partial [Nitrospiraceae bacterium]|nr:hypothetical protein [Nitrospiraceae bacterium]